MTGRRLALLVATYRYQDAGLRQLTSPGHDAEALAEVLRDSEIAGFDVTVLVNEPHYVVGEAIGEFCHNRRRDDLMLLYFTGHGLKDDKGRLYLAMTDTKRDRLPFTALSAQQIDEAMESCSSRQKVLILDCGYSGVFPIAQMSEVDSQVNTLEKFGGRGRVVITASDATQYSFEGDHIVGKGARSVFTRFIVEGLTTGEADLDCDGDISLDELYSYVYDRVIEEMSQQRPKKQENVEGRIVIARNIHWSLPTHVRNAIKSPLAQDRLAVLVGLAHLHRVGNKFVRTEAINETRRLVHDDSKVVSAAAMKLLAALNSEQGVPKEARRAAEESARERPVGVQAQADSYAEKSALARPEGPEPARERWWLRRWRRGRTQRKVKAERREAEAQARRSADDSCSMAGASSGQRQSKAKQQGERQVVTSPPLFMASDVIGSSAPRQVNVWLAEFEEEWQVGKRVAVLFDIGVQRFPVVVSRRFVEPPPPVNDNGQWLYVLLLADGGLVRPVGARLWLPAEGPTAVLPFDVIPTQPGPLVLCFRVFLQQGGLLLQELTASMMVASQPLATRLKLR